MRFSGFRQICTAGLLFATLTGCANLAEQRIVRQFAEALQEENEIALRDVTTSRFQSRAMRSDDAIRDLGIVQLPEKDLEIVNVEDVSETRKLVTVEQNGSNRRLQLALTSSDDGRWKVDDVVMRARHSGVQVSMSVTDQMDLILSVSDFLNSLPEGSRDEILTPMSPGLRKTLQSLPPTWLVRLTNSVAGEYEPSIARRPEAQMNEMDAVVKLPSRNGHIVIRTVRDDEQWLVDDIEVRPRQADDRHPGSIRRQAEAISASVRFLDAYAAGNSDLMKDASTSRFYAKSLSLAGQTLVPLPGSDFAPEDFDLQAFNGHASLSLPVDGRLVRIDMESVDAADQEFNDEEDRLTSLGADYRIEEITIYDDQSGIGKRLTAMYAAPARASLMVRSIRERDLPMIRQLSSSSMNKLVWDRLKPEQLTFLPLGMFGGQSVEINEVRSPGVMTEINMSIDDQDFVYIMREESGGLRIDDIRLIEGENQTSMKTRLALVVPIVQFAQHWSDSQQRDLMEVCSSDFNRRAWDQLVEIPKDNFSDLPVRLIAPVRSSRVTQERAIVQLGHDAASATSIQLVQERGTWLVDDIQMREASGRTVAMQGWLRKEITRQLLGEGNNSIQLASHQETVKAAPRSSTIPRSVSPPTTHARTPSVQLIESGVSTTNGRATDSGNSGVRHADFKTEIPSRGVSFAPSEGGGLVFSPGKAPQKLTAAPDATLQAVPNSSAANLAARPLSTPAAPRSNATSSPSRQQFTDLMAELAQAGTAPDLSAAGDGSAEFGLKTTAQTPQSTETSRTTEAVMFRPRARPTVIGDPADAPISIPR